MNHFQKSNKKLEKLRGLFFQMGLIAACGLTFLAFEWRTTYSIVIPDPIDVAEGIEYEIPPITFPKTIEQPEVKVTRSSHTFRVVKELPEPTPDPTPEPTPNPEPVVPVWEPSPEPEPIVEPKLFTIVEQMPEFIGGEKALFKYLGENINYPEIDLQSGVGGKIYLRFVVGKNGEIEDIEVLRGISPTIDKEAIRVVKAMPKWKPGKQRGKKVRVTYNLPINFTPK